MILKTPQIIWLAIALLSLGIELAKHGERKTDRHNFFLTLLATVLELVILSYGGFFR